MALRLIIQDEEGATTIVPLGEEEITIGREAGNTIQLTEQNVSRQHARLTQGPDGWVLEDLDSYNGIKVNGVPVEAQITLNEGDLVQIGDYHLSLAENAEKAALNVDKPGVAANSNEVGEVIPPSSGAGAATSGEPFGGAAAAGLAGSQRDTKDESFGAPAADLGYDSYEEPERKSGSGGLIVLLLLVAVGVGAYFMFFADDGGTKKGAAGTKVEDAASAGAGAGVAEPAGSAGEGDAAGEEPEPATSAGEPTTSGGAEPEPEPEPEPEEPEPKPKPKPKSEPKSEPEPVKKKAAKKNTKPDEEPEPLGDPVQLLSDARKASLVGNASQAYKLAKQSYAIDRNKEALKLMGVSACKMGDAGKAQKVYAKVDPGTKKALVSICETKGVSLE